MWWEREWREDWPVGREVWEVRRGVLALEWWDKREGWDDGRDGEELDG